MNWNCSLPDRRADMVTSILVNRGNRIARRSDLHEHSPAGVQADRSSEVGRGDLRRRGERGTIAPWPPPILQTEPAARPRWRRSD